MYDFKIVRNYAGALYNNSDSVAEAASMLKELLLILDLVNKLPDLNKFLSSPIIDVNKKHKALKAIASKLNLSKKVEKFILILLNNARFFTLADVVKYFTKIYYDAADMKKVDVISSKPLSELEVKFIRGYLESKLQKKIVISGKVDVNLLGGAVIKYDSTLIDCSIKGAIDMLTRLVI